MTNERAKSELEQLYMSLSEEKKKALDVAFKAMEQADGEKTCGTCRNEDTYHCAECENKSDYEQSQADGEYISKSDVLDLIEDMTDQFGVEHRVITEGMISLLPSVDIPPAEPREVLYSGDGYADGEMVYDMAECMNCGREFEYDDETWGCNFCPDCGQALKWEGEQE